MLFYGTAYRRMPKIGFVAVQMIRRRIYESFHYDGASGPRSGD